MHRSIKTGLGWTITAILGLCAIIRAADVDSPLPKTLDFNRDVRPILSENCFACHGPDDQKRKANLRLDQHNSAFKPAKSGAVPIVPGKTGQRSS